MPPVLPTARLRDSGLTARFLLPRVALVVYRNHNI